MRSCRNMTSVCGTRQRNYALGDFTCSVLSGRHQCWVCWPWTLLNTDSGVAPTNSILNAENAKTWSYGFADAGPLERETRDICRSLSLGLLLTGWLPASDAFVQFTCWLRQVLHRHHLLNWKVWRADALLNLSSLLVLLTWKSIVVNIFDDKLTLICGVPNC